jgi:hypothetical protein
MELLYHLNLEFGEKFFHQSKSFNYFLLKNSRCSFDEADWYLF